MYTKNQRELITDAFRKAKPHLADDCYNAVASDKYHFICHVLTYKLHSHLGARLARKIIQDRLYPYTTLEEWLTKKGVAVYQNKNYETKIMTTRKAWLDSLIKEFSDEA